MLFHQRLQRHAALLLAALVPVAAGAQDTTPANARCELHQSDSGKSLSTFVHVDAPTTANIAGWGWGDGGGATGSFGIKLLENEVVIAKSPLASGDGVQRGSASTSVTLYPGTTYKFRVMPFSDRFGKAKTPRSTALKLSIGDC